MQLRSLGNTDIQISPIALGTWAIGGGPWWGDSDDALSIRAIHTALDLGVNLIDTAPVYGFGRSETIVGQALRDRRDRAVIATKCGLNWLRPEGPLHFTQGSHTVRRNLTPAALREEVDASLTRLQTDRIDLLQTHWQAAEPLKTPIEDTMAALLALRDAGKIRAIGVSNATTAEIDSYRAAGPLASCQPRYSLLDRAIEADILPHCAARGIATLVYSPLEQGLLTGRVTLDTPVPKAEYRHAIPWYSPANRPRVLDMLARWRDLTDKYACTLSQLVIAWTIAQPGVTAALCGARKPQHIQENAAAARLTLDPADVLRMRRDAEALPAIQ